MRGEGQGELRICRWDPKLRPYSLEAFSDYYGPESGWRMWKDAAVYQDATGEQQEVLLRLGSQESWGPVDRLVGESKVLATLLETPSPVLDLDGLGLSGVNCYIGKRIVEYLCGFDSDWWQKTPSIGALDLADYLGMERLLTLIVPMHIHKNWLDSKPMLKHKYYT